MYNCPICNRAVEETVVGKAALYEPRIFDLTKCRYCQVVHFNPIPTKQELTEYYSRFYYDYDNHKEEGRGMVFADRLNRMNATGNFLDIGCSSGFFLYGIKNKTAWNVFGTEYSDNAVRFAQRELSLDVRQGEIYDVGFPGDFFDFIHMEDVLEHVSDPLKVLNECRRILRPNGTFHLSVPNGITDLREKVRFYEKYDRPAFVRVGHIFYFAPKTLEYMFEKTGFRVINAKTYAIKKGLRQLGLLPRKKGWARELDSGSSSHAERSHQVEHVRKKRRSKIYYKYRFMKDNLLMLPGVHAFGNDLLFTLRKS